VIKDALASRHWRPVSRAARLAAARGLTGYTDDLLAVWSRFVEQGPKIDPGCRAKESALTALDVLDWSDPDPFLAAIRYTQFEPVYGGSVDTAGGVRLRALSALLRQHHARALLHAAELLTDPLVEVRAGAAEALGHHAGPVAAALLVQRLRSDDDPRVLLACAAALLELDGPVGRELLAAWLTDAAEERREVAAISLGESKAAEAADCLIAWLERLARDRDVDLGLRALALHRGEPARRYLLECVASGGEARARAAVRALSHHLYDPQLCDRLSEAAARRGDSRLQDEVQRLFRKP
jgi:HEAT repeat protein